MTRVRSSIYPNFLVLDAFASTVSEYTSTGMNPGWAAIGFGVVVIATTVIKQKDL